MKSPANLVIQRREGEGHRPIFARKEIAVNVEDHLEEKIVLNTPIHGTEGGRSRRSHSSTYGTDRECSVESYGPHRKCSRSPTTSPIRDSRNKTWHVTRYDKENSAPIIMDTQILNKPRAASGDQINKDESSEKIDNNNFTPNARDTFCSGSKLHAVSMNRSHRDKSSDVEQFENNRDCSRNSHGRREYGDHSVIRYKGSPKRCYSTDGSPRRYFRYSSSQSCSPEHDNGTKKYISTSKYMLKNSKNPQHHKTNRLPSHSQYTSRDEGREYRDAHSKIKRQFNPGDEKDKEYGYRGSSSRSSSKYFKSRGRSPYSRKHSHWSFHKNEANSRYERRSRSPFGMYHRSRSPSKKHHGYRGDKTNYDKSPSSRDKLEYRDLPSELQYYETDSFWVPGPIGRHGFIPRGMICAPMAVPGNMLQVAPPYVIPRSYMPLPLHHFRQMMSLPYNRLYRHRLTTPVETISHSTSAMEIVTAKSASTAANN